MQYGTACIFGMTCIFEFFRSLSSHAIPERLARHKAADSNQVQAQMLYQRLFYQFRELVQACLNVRAKMNAQRSTIAVGENLRSRREPVPP